MNRVETLNLYIRSGKKYRYRDREFQFLDFMERDGIFRIYIRNENGNEVIEKDSPVALDNFLKLCTAVKLQDEHEAEEIESFTPSLIENDKKEEFIPALLSDNKETFKSVGQMLLEDIQKVRADKNYVPQAKQAANSAQALVNLVKVQLDIIKHG